ncbi:M43 family zinc metalloprotease [Jiulongibacter sp. NS-SX5]|uniref:M43 family zinc metalloprotease n=1 Tax=Jiulongibacter sp. NS-SX5 TaxID=3463854 RepID=UPI00405927DF
MKKLFALCVLILGITSAYGQEECDTYPGEAPIIFDKHTQDSINTIMAINTPYCVRVFVTVFANDDGSNRAASDEDILRQFQNMVNQYDAQSICFMLIGIKQVDNSDLNDHNRTSEESELNPYLVDNCLNIFIHDVLEFTRSNGTIGTLNGTAYAIPNTYLSMVGNNIASLTNTSTLAHEAGHCFGLYHTFENWGETNFENVTRDSGNACYNCTTNGDVLCDTPADDNGSQDPSCNYTGGGFDNCGVLFSPATNNIMGYGNRACRTIFTNGQGARMRSFLITNASLTPLVNQDIVYMPPFSNSTLNYSTGEHVLSARDELHITTFSNTGLNVSGNAEVYIQSKEVRLGTGTHLYPSSGKVRVKSNTYCD